MEVQTKAGRRKQFYYHQALLWIGIGALLRVLLAVLCKGHGTDISCFTAWADRMAQTGSHAFYSDTVFTDYPPGYMYVLWIIGKIHQLFSLPWGSAVGLLLIKLPAIICDTLTAVFVWKLARKRSEKLALYAALFFMFNPAVFINSAVWGQVDSIFTLCVVLTCYLVSEKRLPLSYFIFALGILIKPQTLVFTPVILFGVWNAVWQNKRFQYREFLRQAGFALLAIFSLLIGMLPFGMLKVLTQYVETMTSYPYASINAYNLWALIGKNWMPQDGTLLGISYSKLGTLAILLTVLLAAYICLRAREAKERYIISGAVIIGGMFLFSVRMHERYLYPILALLLLAYVYTKKKEWLISYLLFSAGHFINVFHVLYYPASEAGKLDAIASLDAIFLIVAYVYFIRQVFLSFGLGGKALEEKEEIVILSLPEEEREKMKKKDYLIILAISLVYACIAFYNLGQTKACESAYRFTEESPSVVLDMGSSVYVSKINYFLGNRERRDFQLEVSEDAEGPYRLVSEWEMDSVFCWGSVDINDKGQYYRITSTNPLAMVGELVFYDFDGNTVTPLESIPKAVELYDEQNIYDGRSSFQNSTYFDEIYHARTAYEFLNGEYSYENTHPPLGKIFIALGVKLFGMDPFGWRFMGTLFGVLMIPIFYLFAFKILKNSFLSTITTLLFTFDFMHFVQTRIATIDVFVTLFIMLMYLFMFLYLKEDKYRWLALCGISMGFGVACKWTGAYAGVGLAIIFFCHLFLKYRAAEDKKQCLGNILKTCLFCVVFFIMVPALIYILSYLPFRDGSDRGLIARMLHNQVSMYEYHAHIEATHPYSSWWYQWPTMYRPIWYYSGIISKTVKEGISAFGNPLVWWTGIVAFFYCAYLALRKRMRTAGFLCVAYLAQYLPWFFVTRITFIYHYFPSVPFIALMIGYSMKQFYHTNPVVWRKVLTTYAVCTIFLFAAFYPVLSGMPVSVSYVTTFLRWFDSWVLI